METIAQIQEMYQAAYQAGEDLTKLPLTKLARKIAKQVREDYLWGEKGIISEDGRVVHTHPAGTDYVGPHLGTQVARVHRSTRAMQEELAGFRTHIAEAKELARLGIG